MVRGVAKRSLSQRCVGLGGSPRGIAEFGKGIASSRGEWLSGEGASCGGELAKMDEGGCAVRARLVGARVAALSARRSGSCGGSFTQEFIPTSRPEQLDTAVELGWWNAGFAGGAIQEHAGCKNKQLPAAHFVVGAGRVHCTLHHIAFCFLTGMNKSFRNRAVPARAYTHTHRRESVEHRS